MLLFQYLVNALEGDFLPRNRVYEGIITCLVCMRFWYLWNLNSLLLYCRNHELDPPKGVFAQHSFGISSPSSCKSQCILLLNECAAVILNWCLITFSPLKFLIAISSILFIIFLLLGGIVWLLNVWTCEYLVSYLFCRLQEE